MTTEVSDRSIFSRIAGEHNLGPWRNDEGWIAGPTNLVFRELADIYCRRHNLTNGQLASDLGISPQCCSQWKSGSAGRRPSMGSLVFLCDRTNHQIVIDGDSMTVRRRRKKRS